MVWRRGTPDSRRVLRIFIIKYKEWINWKHFSLACGDGATLAYHDFWNWGKDADAIGDMMEDIPDSDDDDEKEEVEGNNNNENDDDQMGN